MCVKYLPILSLFHLIGLILLQPWLPFYLLNSYLADCFRNFEQYEKVLISPWPDREGNKLQRTNLGFMQHTPHEAQYTS